MSQIRKILFLLLVLVFAVSTMFSGCNQASNKGGAVTDGNTEQGKPSETAKRYSIAFSNPLASLQFQKDLETGMRQAIPIIKEKTGIEIEFTSADAKGSVENIASDVENFIAAGVDMIMMVNLSPPTTQQLIEKAHNAGIGVCVIGQQIGTEDIRIGVADYEGSYDVALETGKWIKDNLNSKGIDGQVLMISGVNSETMKARTKGSIDGLNASGCKWTMVTNLEVTKGTADEALPLVTDAITANPSINVLIGCNDNTAMTCLEVAKQFGKNPDEYVIAGYGLETPSIPTFLQDDCAYRFSYSLPSVYGGNVIMHTVIAYLESIISKDGDAPYSNVLPGFVSNAELIMKYYYKDNNGAWVENSNAMEELFVKDEKYSKVLNLQN